MEKTLRQTLFMAHGDWRLLVFRPLSLTLLLIGAIVLVAPAGVVRRRRANSDRRIAEGAALRR